VRASYCANPDKKKAALRASYSANPDKKDPDKKKAASSYCADADKILIRKWPLLGLHIMQTLVKSVRLPSSL
jgi:hypothetical protein